MTQQNPSNPPPMPPPQQAPLAPTPPQKGGWLKWLRLTLVIVSVLVALLIWFGRKSKMGTAYKVTDKERVNYSGTATEKDAQVLGDALKAEGVFDGSGEKDVLLKRDAEGTTVSFVTGSDWDTPGNMEFFTAFGAELLDKFPGSPLKVTFLDDKLNTLKDVPIDPTATRMGTKFIVSDLESVFYSGAATEEDAKLLGEKLKEITYFNHSRRNYVLLFRNDAATIISYTVGDITLDDAKLIDSYTRVTGTLRPPLKDPLKIRLIDNKLHTKKEIDVP